MIVIPVRKCLKINCTNLIKISDKYCDEHKELNYEYDRQRYSNDKEVRQVYNNKIWRNTRQSILMRDNYNCLYCLARGMVNPATAVDHYIPVRDSYDLRYDMVNLVSTCISCNNIKQKDEELLRTNQISREEYDRRWQFEIEE